MCIVATAKYILNVHSKVHRYNKLIEKLLFTSKEYVFLTTTDDMEERVDTTGDSADEEETDPRVREEVREIVSAFLLL